MSATSTEFDLDVRQLAGNIRAEIDGVDVREPLSPATADEIRRRCCATRWCSCVTSTSSTPGRSPSQRGSGR
ncbi:MAG: hypothetical protein WBH47_11200 [Streptosporangiaceae bacterium]